MKITIEIQDPGSLLRKAAVVAVSVAVLGVGLRVAFAQTSGLQTLTAGTPISATQLNQNFTYLNGRVDTVNNVATQASSTASAAAPPGTIVAFAGATAPNGWLACDGSIIDPIAQTQYAALRAAIGDSWGDGGDGSSPKFNLPDLRGMFLRGKLGSRSDQFANPDGDQAVGATNGDRYFAHNHGLVESGSHSHGAATAAAGEHTHGYSGWIDPGNVAGAGPAVGKTYPIQNYTVGPAGIHTHGISADGSHTHTMQSAGGNETRPKNAIVLYIIKY